MSDLTLTDIDFDVVNATSDPKILSHMLLLLEAEPFYVDLMTAVRHKLDILSGINVKDMNHDTNPKNLVSIANELQEFEFECGNKTKELDTNKNGHVKILPAVRNTKSNESLHP